jgi:excisionase family DNA binding protein
MTTLEQHRRLLTVSEAAARLGQSDQTVRRKIRSGMLPAVQLGGPRSAVRIDERDLETWLYARRP